MTIEDIEKKRKQYEIRIKSNIIGSSPLFVEWFGAAREFFKINVDNNDEDYKIFSMAKPSGNEYVLRHYYEELIGSYRALVAICNNSIQKNSNMDKNKVFVVHGHDELLLIKVENLLRQLGLTPVILNQEANKGMTLIEKLDMYSDVGFAIILYTPCDKAKDSQKKGKYNWRARQNVVFEHGFLYAKLGKSNIAVLKQGDIEMPSDISGIAYVESGEWRYILAQELQEAGIPVDKNKIH